jgi:NAD(P)-dependent dehydrogenase (short-subunit alcohol dehydrogenase family)
MAPVRAVAADFQRRFDRLDVLVNNAGAIFTSRQVTADGFERTFALNHMSYFLLTNLLLPQLSKAPQPRVVNVSSQGHRLGKVDFDDLQMERNWSAFGAYGTTKLENLLFTFELARRYPNIASNALHPGAVASGFGRNEGGWMKRLFGLASSPEAAGQTGRYFIKQKAKAPSKAALDPAAQKRLWDESVRLFGLSA